MSKSMCKCETILQWVFSYLLLLLDLYGDVLGHRQTLYEQFWSDQMPPCLSIDLCQQFRSDNVDMSSQGTDGFQLAAGLCPLLPLDGRRLCKYKITVESLRKPLYEYTLSLRTTSLQMGGPWP